jgi:hypothetical protein
MICMSLNGCMMHKERAEGGGTYFKEEMHMYVRELICSIWILSDDFNLVIL